MGIPHAAYPSNPINGTRGTIKGLKGPSKSETSVFNASVSAEVKMVKEIESNMYKTAPMVNIHNVNSVDEDNNVLRKVGAFMIPGIPLEAKMVIQRVNVAFKTDVLGEIKTIGVASIISSFFVSVFNVNFIVIIAALFIIAALDYITGIIPRPKGAGKVRGKGDISILDRLHMFGYLTIIFVVFSAFQVAAGIIIALLEPQALNSVIERYPDVSELILDTISLHQLSALGIVVYYLNRIRKHAAFFMFRKQTK